MYCDFYQFTLLMSKLKTFARQSHLVDPHYSGEPQLIAVGVLESSSGLILVDPGPQVSLNGLLDGLTQNGISSRDISDILLTHIHLDHAGGVGHIAAINSDITVHVHEIGAPHLIDPSRLLRSAERIYGDAMEETWGEMIGVPAEQVSVVADQDFATLGGRSFRVIYTPGHAKHHVSYLDERSGYAFVGDVAGQRTTGVPYVMPVTPPPDVDLPAWSESLDKLESKSLDGLFLTHFGPSEDPADHIQSMREKLSAWSEEVRRDLALDGSDEVQAEAFERKKLSELRRELPPKERKPYELFAHPGGSWHGLALYWRNQS